MEPLLQAVKNEPVKSYGFSLNMVTVFNRPYSLLDYTSQVILCFVATCSIYFRNIATSFENVTGSVGIF